MASGNEKATRDVARATSAGNEQPRRRGARSETCAIGRSLRFWLLRFAVQGDSLHKKGGVPREGGYDGIAAGRRRMWEGVRLIGRGRCFVFGRGRDEGRTQKEKSTTKRQDTRSLVVLLLALLARVPPRVRVRHAGHPPLGRHVARLVRGREPEQRVLRGQEGARRDGRVAPPPFWVAPPPARRGPDLCYFLGCVSFLWFGCVGAEGRGGG